MPSPTQRSLQLLRKNGWLCQIVERWNSFAKKRQDLFGIIDLLAIKLDITLGVQCTSASNISARISKAKENTNLLIWLKDPHRKFEIWGWYKSKRKKKWICRRIIISTKT